MLFPALAEGGSRSALRFGERSLSYGELAAVAGRLAASLKGASRVAVWATPSMETAVGVVAALLAGVPAVPINPKIGERELAHIVGDCEPIVVLAAHGDELPSSLQGLVRLDPTVALPGTSPLPVEPAPDH
ncbi:AMP-binding protein, partial [Streptomyces sp. YC504]